LNTGVRDEHTIEVSLRPNPANEKLHVFFSSPMEEAQVNIYGIDGRVMWTEHINGVQSHEMSIADLPPGIYVFEIRTQSEIKVVKFVKA